MLSLIVPVNNLEQCTQQSSTLNRNILAWIFQIYWSYHFWQSLHYLKRTMNLLKITVICLETVRILLTYSKEISNKIKAWIPLFNKSKDISVLKCFRLFSEPFSNNNLYICVHQLSRITGKPKGELIINLIFNDISIINIFVQYKYTLQNTREQKYMIDYIRENKKERPTTKADPQPPKM